MSTSSHVAQRDTASLSENSLPVQIVQIAASANTNGIGGGAVVEGRYAVYKICPRPTGPDGQCN